MKFYSSVIFVHDIEKSKEFYIQVLDQDIEHDFGKNVIFKSGLTIWEIQPKHIIGERLQTRSKSNRFELYFETEQLEEVYGKLKSAGVEFFHEIHEEPWGQRTLRFFDCDHHLIEVGETLETFVWNMKDRGLSLNQISEKSGIPMDTLKILLDSNQ